MFGTVKYGANAYEKVGVETGVVAASPHKLITMLFDGAIVAIMNAKQHMEAGSVAEKGQSISKAIMIVDSGLRESLNKEAGGEIATNLDSLYEYIANRLLEANLNNRMEYLEEAQQLLSDLKDAWETIGEKDSENVAQPDTDEAAYQPTTYDPLMPRTSRLARA